MIIFIPPLNKKTLSNKHVHVIQNLIFTILLMHGKFGSFLFSFYSKIILFLTLNKKDLFLNKKYSFFTIIKKKIKLDELKYCLILEARGEE
ncbi:hypothetical protein CVT45_07660 [Enterococcus faecium Com15]|nr:hypothetical protein CVT45_07660 [Enterococcus faecium Com15]